MLAELAHEELAAGLDAAAVEILDVAGTDAPPVDAFRVARALGITVAMDDRQQGRARYVRLRGFRSSRPQAAILLRSDPRPERRQWAVAHEIGEHVACRVFRRLGIDPGETPPRAREQVANELAGRILLPAPWFSADGRDCGWDLIQLKARYDTASHELIARRMLHCRPPVIISIFDHGGLYFRRSNLPGRVPPLSATEKECWKAVHELARADLAYAGLRAIQGWPVHEPGWKREFLRTEVDEYPADEPAPFE
jgi:Zn-dependent peptidase ImmA (M78 family)